MNDLDHVLGFRILSLFKVTILSDGIPVSSNKIKLVNDAHSEVDDKFLPAPCKFKIAFANELHGIGCEKLYCITIVDFEFLDKLIAKNSTFSIYSDKNQVTNAVTGMSFKNSTHTFQINLDKYSLNEDDFYSESSFLMHTVFGPPVLTRNGYIILITITGHIVTGHKHYYKVELFSEFQKYLNSDTFYIPDTVTSDKYLVASDSESEVNYSDCDDLSEYHDSVDLLSDPIITNTISDIKDKLNNGKRCVVKYRNIFVLDGCWIINNSYTVSNERDVVLLLKSSCKWRECEYQENELYLIERNKIDPSNEFRLYYTNSKLLAIAQLHSHIKLPYLLEKSNRSNVVKQVMRLSNDIDKILDKLNLHWCIIDIALDSKRFIIDILPWGWNGPLAHQSLMDWRNARLLYISADIGLLSNIINCAIDTIENVYFLYIQSESQLRNGPFGNNMHPDDISEINDQFS